MYNFSGRRCSLPDRIEFTLVSVQPCSADTNFFERWLSLLVWIDFHNSRHSAHSSAGCKDSLRGLLWRLFTGTIWAAFTRKWYHNFRAFMWFGTFAFPFHIFLFTLFFCAPCKPSRFFKLSNTPSWNIWKLHIFKCFLCIPSSNGCHWFFQAKTPPSWFFFWYCLRPVNFFVAAFLNFVDITRQV